MRGITFVFIGGHFEFCARNRENLRSVLISSKFITSLSCYSASLFQAFRQWSAARDLFAPSLRSERLEQAITRQAFGSF